MPEIRATSKRRSSPKELHALTVPLELTRTDSEEHNALVEAILSVC